LDNDENKYRINVSICVEIDKVSETSATVLMQMLYKHLMNAIDDSDYHFPQNITHIIGKLELKKGDSKDADETK
jgi:hypothetical protein